MPASLIICFISTWLSWERQLRILLFLCWLMSLSQTAERRFPLTEFLSFWTLDQKSYQKLRVWNILMVLSDTNLLLMESYIFEKRTFPHNEYAVLHQNLCREWVHKSSVNHSRLLLMSSASTFFDLYWTEKVFARNSKTLIN